jgi:hypothetical protein
MESADMARLVKGQLGEEGMLLAIYKENMVTNR